MDTEQEKSERNRDKFCHNYGFLGQVEDSVDTEEELIKHDQERQKKKTKSRRLNVKRKGYHEVRLKEDDSTQGEDTPVHAPKCTEDTHVVLDSRSVKDNTENKNEEFMLQHIINPKMKVSAGSSYFRDHKERRPNDVYYVVQLSWGFG
ncbi:hypothetical protein CAPTEDRAFT_215058 [Capitella teleta]|uniref:Uncharacterized protein n=1 Tax=Capitella teleta TaxID=283909 RepID=R7UXK5_CAPTE|nr:hypothetical protein CAPTEDRAFT_215058 [Capitella teleta]|eukprot:ELU08652.1 hypothetical protein CAPTEDRAFT_215058 [Capitella teleta]